MTVDWPTTTLGEVAQLQRGLAYVAPQLRPPGRPFITLKCFEKGGGFRWDGLKTFSGPVPPEYFVDEGELLIANTDLTRDASVVGAPALVPRFASESAVFSMDVSRLVTDVRCADNRFLALRLAAQDARSFMQARSGGSTVLHLHLRAVPKFVFQLPSLPEQRQIAAILDTIDDTILKTEQIIAKLKQVKRGLLHDLLTRGIDDNGELRDSGRHPAQFKDSPLGRIPKQWEASAVANLCSEVVDCPHSTPAYLAEGVPAIRTADITPGVLLLDQAYRVDEATYRQRTARLEPRAGDVIYSREGGRLGIAGSVGDERLCLAQRVMLLRPAEATDPTYLVWSMNATSFLRQVFAMVGASASPHVNVADVAAFLVARPPPEEQLRIGQVLRAHDRRLLLEQSAREKLVRLKIGLMEDLLTGRVRVTALLPGAAG